MPIVTHLAAFSHRRIRFQHQLLRQTFASRVIGVVSFRIRQAFITIDNIFFANDDTWRAGVDQTRHCIVSASLDNIGATFDIDPVDQLLFSPHMAKRCSMEDGIHPTAGLLHILRPDDIAKPAIDLKRLEFRISLTPQNANLDSLGAELPDDLAAQKSAAADDQAIPQGLPLLICLRFLHLIHFACYCRLGCQAYLPILAASQLKKLSPI